MSEHARLLCPPLSPRVCSNSCPLRQWCLPTISYSASLFSSCLQSFPASGSFPMSRLFASGGQSIGASASVLSMNIQGWFPLGLTGWISLQTKGLSRVFSNTTAKASICWCSGFFIVQLSHPYMTTRKTTAFTIRTFVGIIGFCKQAPGTIYNRISMRRCIPNSKQPTCMKLFVR